MNKVIIQYKNGSQSTHVFMRFSLAREFCRNNISYSGDRVKRVEIHDGESKFAMWDSSWDAISQHAGLNNT